MRNIVIIAVLALVAAGIVPRLVDRTGTTGPSQHGQVAATAEPAARLVTAASGGSRSVTIPHDDHGHFRVEGEIDGRRLGFMVDTGASFVSLTEGDAARLGYHPGRRDYTVRVSTANGEVRAAPISLDIVEIGGVMVRHVPAIVMPEEALSDNLLGLSFLSRLHRFEYRDGRLVLEE